MNIVIIDDEQQHIDLIAIKINELSINELNIVGTFTKLDDAEIFINENKIDLLFLDIVFTNETKNVNEAGFHFLKRFDSYNTNFNVVFVSGKVTEENRARAASLAGFELIEKPIITQYIATAIINILYRMLNEKDKFIENSNLIFQNAIANFMNTNSNENKIKITIRKDHNGRYLDAQQTIFIKIADILFFESSDKKIKIKTTTDEYLTTVGSIIAYEEKLKANNFIKNSQRYLVNINRILSYDKDKITFDNQLPDGTYLTIENIGNNFKL